MRWQCEKPTAHRLPVIGVLKWGSIFKRCGILKNSVMELAGYILGWTHLF
ncbi:hypothetical protein BN2497_12511 [Janthinobacterium sp. CG23_2]|nr:hypothetical protein BN2497_12511 [Janthinobacterium sp. CG23_2]CUU32653.1 hypothetical protein BN3177_12511 [Janthinobacterium sp. CG23_2]